MSNLQNTFFSTLLHYEEALTSLRPTGGDGGEGVKNLGNGMEPKNQVIWNTRCKVMAKYTLIPFDILCEKLVCSGLPPAISKIFFY